MNINTITALVAAASLSGMALAQEQDTAPATAENSSPPVEAEQLDEEETPFISAEFGLAFDSKYMTYGVVDGRSPIVTPSAEVSFFETLYFGVESIFDVGRGNGGRGGKYSTLDAIVGLRHDFDLGERLGALSVDVNYIYEYIPRRNWNDDTGKKDVDDTQYVNLELALGDLWLEPTLSIERDLMADDGTYANLELGHNFDVCEHVTLRPAVGQGLGNTQRTKGYFSEGKYEDGFSHGGLMDTSFSLTAEWEICEHLTLSGYVAYYDYLLDSNMRSGAREHNLATTGRNDSAQFVGGLALTASF